MKKSNFSPLFFNDIALNFPLLLFSFFVFGNHWKSGFLNFHFFSRVVITAFKKITNNIGAKLSPCLTPHVDLKIDSMFSIVKLIVVLLYSFLRTIIIFSGTPQRARIFQRSSRFTVSYALTRLTNIAWTDCPCSRNVCMLRFTAKFESWQPFCFIDPHWFLLWIL